MPQDTPQGGLIPPLAELTALPRFYANGFTNSITNSDVVLVLQANGAPAALVNMSYTTAKTLTVLLGRFIASLEAELGQEIPTTERMDQVLAALTSEPTIQ